MAGFRYLEHISETYVEAYGESLEEAFESAGRALFNLMTDISKVDPKESREVRVEGEDKCALLLEWLSELICQFDLSLVVYSEFKVHEIAEGPEGHRLRATIRGERFDPQRHPSKTEVKAATYSLMEIIEKPGNVTLRFVLDI